MTTKKKQPTSRHKTLDNATVDDYLRAALSLAQQNKEVPTDVLKRFRKMVLDLQVEQLQGTVKI